MGSERRARQPRGAALIVALVVVAIVAILSVTVSSDFLLMFRRVENQMYSEQAYAYLLGAEGVARLALLKDQKLAPDVDTLVEDWALPQKFPTDYGWIAGQLEDMQGRFNLNLLTKPPTAGETHSEQQRLLIRLLQALPLAEPLALDQAEALVDAISDWIDSDDTPSRLSGAESQYYADADPPGRPANRALKSPSELMWVKGMTAEIYRALVPFVTVWPQDSSADSAINLNTAPAVVLRCINEKGNLAPLDPLLTERILEQRKSQGFIKLDVYTGEELTAPDVNFLAETSKYFQLTAQTEFQGRRYTLRSVILRDQKNIRVIARTFGEW